MSTEIEENQGVILRYLYKVDIESEGKMWLDGNGIYKATNLTSVQINDALEILHLYRLVRWVGAVGTEPYKFHKVQITARGKNAVQKTNFPKQVEARTQDPRKVFVVHGRNLDARDALFEFLRSIDLHPLEWSELVIATGKGSPYIGEILDKAFSQAQAVIVLMTPDDEGCLREPFRKPEDPTYETELTGQARLNVLFEAGIAMGRSSERTILVELGALRPFSDIAGRHIIKLDNTVEKRQELAQRLKTAGCSVNLSGMDWYKAGDFLVNFGENKEGRFKTSPSEFILQRFEVAVEKPVKSNWSIRVLHPNKPIEKCIVLYDGIRLPWWDKDVPYYEKTIVAGGGGNVRIPVEIEKEDAEVKIMDGKRVLRQEKFKEIVINSP